MTAEEEKTLVGICDHLMTQVDHLQKENQELMEWRKGIHDVLYSLQDAIANAGGAIGSMETDLNNVATVAMVLRQNIEYELNDPFFNKIKYEYPIIISEQDTIDELIKNRKSFARFGDGEFSIMAGQNRQKFQSLNDDLAQRLLQVLHSRMENFMVGIADNYGHLQRYNYGAANAIRYYMTPETRALHEQYLEKGRKYYDAYISRPYVLRADRFTDGPAKRFANLKRIWEDRNVVIVEGAHTRFGVGNDFMDGARSVRRILAPATSSYDRYDEIRTASLAIASPDDLFLIAMGPSAGVMAYDLCQQGIQAVDIGHADLEYEWFRVGTGNRVAVPYKYNNEFVGGHEVEAFSDPRYESEIIASYAD